MNSKIKNILILVVVAVALILIYIFFIKKGSVDSSLTSSNGVTATESSSTTTTTTDNVAKQASSDFISLLLSVKSIKLDDTILSDMAFLSLKDSTILLTQTGDEGRPNPFAPIGSENITMPIVTPTIPTTPVVPVVPHNNSTQ